MTTPSAASDTGTRALWIAALAVGGITVVGAAVALSSSPPAPAPPQPTAGGTTPGSTTPPVVPGAQSGPTTHTIAVTAGSGPSVAIVQGDTLNVTTPGSATNVSANWAAPPTPATPPQFIQSKSAQAAPQSAGTLMLNGTPIGAAGAGIPTGTAVLNVTWNTATVAEAATVTVVSTPPVPATSVNV